MSTIKVTNIEHGSTTDGGIQLDNAGHVTVDGQQMPTAGALSNRNLIINGAMQVAQRGSSFTGITGGNSKFIADRFRLNVDFGTFSGEQSSTAPSGFSNSIKVDCTATATPAIGTNENFLEHIIEAQNLQHLRYGESGAKSITLSFYVRSNKTGSYGIWFYAQDGVRHYATTYTISTADTWEFKTVTVPGDVSGTINNDNGAGIYIRWYLGAGSSYMGTPAGTWEAVGVNRTTSLNLADSTSNEWFIAGVQLEVGEKATPFEHRSYGDELARCQRYYERRTVGSQNNERLTTTGLEISATGVQFPVKHLVPKRTTPDINVGNLANSNCFDGTALGTPSGWALDNTGIFVTNIGLSGLSGGALGRAAHWAWSNTQPTPFIEIDSEL